MKIKRILVFLVLINLVSGIYGLEYDDFFPESMGLGGAYTSVMDSPASIFFNPASLYFYRGSVKPVYYVSIGYGKSGYENYNFLRYADEISGIVQKPYGQWDDSDISNLINSLQGASEEKPSANGGKGYSFLVARDGFAVYFLEHGYSDIVFDIDLERLSYSDQENPDSILNNLTALEFHGLKLREYCISYSSALDDDLFIGTTLKFITAESYFDELGLFDMNELQGRDINHYVDSSFDFNRQTSNGYTFDLGIMMKLGPWGLLGFSAKNIKKIEIDGAFGKINIKPQYRVGFTFLLSQTSFITIDRDLTENDTLVSQDQSQKLSIGLQKSFFENAFVLRAGARRDDKSRDSSWRYYFGAGLRIAEYLDFQGAYHYASSDDSSAYNFGLNLIF